MVLWGVWALGRRYRAAERGSVQGPGQNSCEGRAVFWGAGTVWGAQCGAGGKVSTAQGTRASLDSGVPSLSASISSSPHSYQY